MGGGRRQIALLYLQAVQLSRLPCDREQLALAAENQAYYHKFPSDRSEVN